MKEWIYILKSGDYYKIGRTRRIRHRFSSYLTHQSSPFILIFAYKTTSAREEEISLLKRFIDKKIRNEWFSLNETDLSTLRGEFLQKGTFIQNIDELEKYEPKQKWKRENRPEHIVIRLTREEHSLLKKMSEEQNLPMVNLVRKALLGHKMSFTPTNTSGAETGYNKISMTVPPSMYLELVKLADSEMRSPSSMAGYIVKKYFKERNTPVISKELDLTYDTDEV